MAVLDDQARLSAPAPAERRAATRFPAWFDGGFAALALLLIAGNYLDGWAHSHRLVGTSFFTPWHGAAYGCLVLSSAYLTVTFVRYGSLTSGYGWSAVGVAVTVIGGLADMLWHTFVGIEVSVQAALSPPHLILSTGLVLLVLGPWRAAATWPGDRSPTWRQSWPALASLLAAWSMFTLQAQFIHPFSSTWIEPLPLSTSQLDGLASQVLGEALQLTRPGLGVAAVVVQAAVMAYILLALLRRWQPPAGALTIFVTINAIAMATQRDHWQAIPAGLVAGILADALAHRLPQAIGRESSARVLAVATPMILMGIYLLIMFTRQQLAASANLWLGTVLVAGLTGWILGGLTAPPLRPEAQVDYRLRPGGN